MEVHFKNAWKGLFHLYINKCGVGGIGDWFTWSENDILCLDKGGN